MTRVTRRIEKLVRRSHLAGPSTATYLGINGAAWFVGSVSRAASFAEFFCGDDVHLASHDHVPRRKLPEQIERIAADGGLPILSVPDTDAGLSEVLPRSIEVPTLVDIHIGLPEDVGDIGDALLTSTTREDFRRIRKAGFTYRVTKDPDAIREFHARHVTPLIETQFPEDGNVGSVDKMVASLGTGGELVCADIDGEWVAGILNNVDETTYALISLGIRDADNSVRQKRVVAALIVRSIERAAELGLRRATLGRSLPFLGKGPLWFKVKWGGVITRRPDTRMLNMFMNLQSAAVRRMLAASPIIHTHGDALAASAWLDPGDKPLHDLVRDSGRFPGIARWYVLGEDETISAGMETLATSSLLVPVVVDHEGDQPVWLGEVH